MDVATPTADCLSLVYDLLLPVVSKPKNSLSHQEVRGFGLNFLLGDLLFFCLHLIDLLEAILAYPEKIKIIMFHESKNRL